VNTGRHKQVAVTVPSARTALPERVNQGMWPTLATAGSAIGTDPASRARREAGSPPLATCRTPSQPVPALLMPRATTMPVMTAVDTGYDVGVAQVRVRIATVRCPSRPRLSRWTAPAAFVDCLISPERASSSAPARPLRRPAQWLGHRAAELLVHFGLRTRDVRRPWTGQSVLHALPPARPARPAPLSARTGGFGCLRGFSTRPAAHVATPPPTGSALTAASYGLLEVRAESATTFLGLGPRPGRS